MLSSPAQVHSAQGSGYSEVLGQYCDGHVLSGKLNPPDIFQTGNILQETGHDRVGGAEGANRRKGDNPETSKLLEDCRFWAHMKRPRLALAAGVRSPHPHPPSLHGSVEPATAPVSVRVRTGCSPPSFGLSPSLPGTPNWLGSLAHSLPASSPGGTGPGRGERGREVPADDWLCGRPYRQEYCAQKPLLEPCGWRSTEGKAKSIAQGSRGGAETKHLHLITLGGMGWERGRSPLWDQLRLCPREESKCPTPHL